MRRLPSFFFIVVLLLVEVRVRRGRAIVESGLDCSAGLRLAIFGDQAAGRGRIE